MFFFFLKAKDMYLVQLYYEDWSYTWEECFPTLADAVRFGMRMYRNVKSITSFKTIYYPKYERKFLRLW